VSAVSWLLSVSESTSMHEKGACGHCVPGYGVPGGYCPTPVHKGSSYRSLLHRSDTVLYSTLTPAFKPACNAGKLNTATTFSNVSRKRPCSYRTELN
jgi:hypothetical protein